MFVIVEIGEQTVNRFGEHKVSIHLDAVIPRQPDLADECTHRLLEKVIDGADVKRRVIVEDADQGRTCTASQLLFGQTVSLSEHAGIVGRLSRGQQIQLA